MFHKGNANHANHTDLTGHITRYEILRNSRVIPYKDRHEITEGCTLDQRDQEPILIRPFPNKGEALEALKQYSSEIAREKNSAGKSFYLFTEYYVQESVYDAEGNFLESPNIWAFTPMPDKGID